MKTYQKTATIQAERFDGSEEMIQKYNVYVNKDFNLSPSSLKKVYKLPTLEGDFELRIGDWIATGVKNEHWTI